MELLRGLGAACSVLLLLALGVLPVKEPPGSFLQAIPEALWARPAVAQGQRSVVLTQVGVRLNRKVQMRLSEDMEQLARFLSANDTAVAAGVRAEEQTPKALFTKRHGKHQAANVARSEFVAPTKPDGVFDSPGWRVQHGHGRNVFYLHIWKCGGTNLCKIARANGELANEDWGCHSPDPTRVNGWRPCSEPRNFKERYPQLTFVGSECPLKGDEPFDDPSWNFVVVLREPLTQATSWYLHARQVARGNVPSFYDWTRKVKTQRGIFFEQFEDNLQTRFICGWACNDKPVLDESDFEQAKENLRKFKVVMRLEELNSENGMHAAGEALGWSMLSGEDKSVGTKRHVTEKQAESKFPNAAKHLKELLRWDQELYEYSKTLPQR